MAGVGIISTDTINKAFGLKPGGGRTPADVARSARGFPNYLTGGALTAGGIGAGVALQSSAALLSEVAPGLLSLGPYGAAALAALGIADLVFGGALQGKPKMQDTVEAVVRLFQSQNPEVQQLARNLAILVKNQAPLSSGNPAIQAQIRDWIGGAVRTILGPQASNPNAVGQLDTAIRRVLTSEVAAPASSLDATIAQLTRLPGNASAIAGQQTAISTRPPANPFPVLQPHLPLAQRNAPQPVGFPAPQPQPADNSILDRLNEYAAQHPYLNLAGCIALIAAQQYYPATICLEELLKNQLEQTGRRLIENTRDYLRSLFHRQPTQPAPYPLDTPGPQAPLLDTTKPCPECDRRGRQIGEQLSQQETRLQRDIRTEQEQDLEQELEQQEQELAELEQLETQPAGQRNIKQELSRKAELQQKILQEQGELASQPDHQFPDLTGQQPAPQLQQPAQQQIEREIKSELEQQRKHEDIPVTFCIGCKNQEDAIMFLNGEPSACSVMPGTTQFLGGH